MWKGLSSCEILKVSNCSMKRAKKQIKSTASDVVKSFATSFSFPEVYKSWSNSPFFVYSLFLQKLTLPVLGLLKHFYRIPNERCTSWRYRESPLSAISISADFPLVWFEKQAKFSKFCGFYSCFPYFHCFYC